MQKPATLSLTFMNTILSEVDKVDLYPEIIVLDTPLVNKMAKVAKKAAWLPKKEFHLT